MIEGYYKNSDRKQRNFFNEIKWNRVYGKYNGSVEIVYDLCGMFYM